MPEQRRARRPAPTAASADGVSVWDRVISEAARVVLADEKIHNPRDTRRPKQRPPEGDWWTIWLAHCGRGWGKTMTGALWLHDQVAAGVKQIALVSATAADARDVMILNPRSGLIATAPEGWELIYEKTNRRVVWVRQGAIAHVYSAEEPDRLRGPEHEAAWADEVDSWGEKTSAESALHAWDNLMLGLRIGKRPKVFASSTPKPGRIIARILRRAQELKDVAITTGSTYENQENLAEAFLKQVVSGYEGTRLGRQEIEGELLTDVDGALWRREQIDEARVTKAPMTRQNGVEFFDADRALLAIDPAFSTKSTSAETGMVMGFSRGDQAYVVRDDSGRYSPDAWARRAVGMYHNYALDAIVVEVNHGADMVIETIRHVDPGVNIIRVHASRGKTVRAEPVAALYEQGRVHHVGTFPLLEDQLCNMTIAGYAGDDGSPDRADALVWLLSELFQPPRRAYSERLR